VDRDGNVYVTFPESPRAYPDYTGAAIKYVHADAALHRWSAPVTVAGAGGAGHVLPHIVAGDRGRVDFAYFTGHPRKNADPAWYLTASQTLDGLGSHPHLATRQASPIPAYTGTASKLMGACGEGPAEGVENGFACGRATDVWGVALDHRGHLTIAWPTVKNQVPHSAPATYVSTQTGGPSAYLPACSLVAILPRSLIASLRLGADRRVRLAGRAHAYSCRARVAREKVAIAQRLRHGRCRFVQASGTLRAAGSCHRPIFLTARGTGRWSFTAPRALPAGQYQVGARAVDTLREVERAARRNVARFRVR
jgi:hypothetical protein